MGAMGAGKQAFEVVVVGCGGIGSAALYWFSRELGPEVLGLEQFHLGRERGASQDHSRIIRLSYHAPEYVALARHAYGAWREAEQESGVTLVLQTGGLDLEPPGVSGEKDLDHCAAALRAQGIEFEQLDAAGVMRRWPQYRLPEGVRGLYQAAGGLVDARKANAVHATLARARGATILEGTAVRALRVAGERVEVETDGARYTAARVVVAADAWTNRVLGSLGVRWPLTVTQEQVTYFATPHLREFAPERFPVWIWRAPQSFYGFPVYGEVATKAGQDVGGAPVTAETRTFEPDPLALERLERFLGAHLPGFRGPVVYTKTCLYTMPPDRHFVLDALPAAPHVAVALGAGHAFKFAALFGRILCDLALKGESPYPIGAFRADRAALTDADFPSRFRNETVYRS
jgi:sarcosine oxidase